MVNAKTRMPTSTKISGSWDVRMGKKIRPQHFVSINIGQLIELLFIFLKY